MEILDKKIKTHAKNIIIEFNLKNKIAGSDFENYVVAYKNGLELSQSEYDIIKSDNGEVLQGEVIVDIPIIKILDIYFNKSLSSFSRGIVGITGIDGIYNNESNMYEPFSSSNMKKYVNRDYILKAKVNNPNFISVKFSISKSSSSLGIVSDTFTDNKSILFQGLTLDYSIKDEQEIFSALDFYGANDGFDYTFESGELPEEFMYTDYSPIFPIGPELNEKVLAFGNTGEKYSESTILFDYDFRSPVDLNIEFFVSTAVEDIFYIDVGSKSKLAISGNTTPNIDYNYEDCNVTVGEWVTYTIKNLKGNDTVFLYYDKSGKWAGGLDNVFIKRIYTTPASTTKSAETPRTGLFYKNNKFYIKKGEEILLESDPMILKKGATLDILLGFNNALSLDISHNGKISTFKAPVKCLGVGETDMSILKKGVTKNALLEALFVINKNVSDLEKEGILLGIKPAFTKPRVLSGLINPNTSYIIEEGSAVLFSNELPTREVTGEFITTESENRILINDDIKCFRK